MTVLLVLILMNVFLILMTVTVTPTVPILTVASFVPVIQVTLTIYRRLPVRILTSVPRIHAILMLNVLILSAHMTVLVTSACLAQVYVRNQ